MIRGLSTYTRVFHSIPWQRMGQVVHTTLYRPATLGRRRPMQCPQTMAGEQELSPCPIPTPKLVTHCTVSESSLGTERPPSPLSQPKPSKRSARSSLKSRVQAQSGQRGPSKETHRAANIPDTTTRRSSNTHKKEETEGSQPNNQSCAFRSDHPRSKDEPECDFDGNQPCTQCSTSPVLKPCFLAGPDTGELEASRMKAWKNVERSGAMYSTLQRWRDDLAWRALGKGELVHLPSGYEGSCTSSPVTSWRLMTEFIQ